jgi:hypothetical protein
MGFLLFVNVLLPLVNMKKEQRRIDYFVPAVNWFAAGCISTWFMFHFI